MNNSSLISESLPCHHHNTAINIIAHSTHSSPSCMKSKLSSYSCFTYYSDSLDYPLFFIYSCNRYSFYYWVRNARPLVCTIVDLGESHKMNAESSSNLGGLCLMLFLVKHPKESSTKVAVLM